MRLRNLRNSTVGKVSCAFAALFVLGRCWSSNCSGHEYATAVTDDPDERPQEDDLQHVEDSSVEELLKMLDSPRYLEREAATIQLVNLGNRSLKPMAMHFLQSSPESSWRIKRSLEEIATDGDEKTFLKAVALLHLLVGNNSDQLQAQLLRLKYEWSTKQTVSAIKTLVAAGARVENYAPANNAQAIQNWIDKENSQAKQKKAKNNKLENKSKTECVKLISEILTGSLKENRKLVLGSGIPIQQGARESREVFEVLERQLANRIVIRNGVILQVNGSNGVIVRFDNAWDGKRSQFAELENVDSLSHVSFEKQYVDRSKLETLKNISSLTTLEFKNCRFSGPALATVGLPKTINDLRFLQQDIELSTIDRIAKLPIKSLVFDGCKFSDAALKKMLTFSTLSHLELAQMKLDASVFERIEKMKTLRSLKLSGCKYPFPAYKRLSKNRPEIYVDFTTTAFLGVRSVPGESKCQISDVVSDSGAEKGGVQVDDIIVEVNGHEIDQFNDLRAHIALCKNGDQLDLTVMRAGEIVELKVILGDSADAPPR